jgi:hypothetical protein
MLSSWLNINMTIIHKQENNDAHALHPIPCAPFITFNF